MILRIYNGSITGNYEYKLLELTLDGAKAGTFKTNITWHGNTKIKVQDEIYHTLIELGAERIINKEDCDFWLNKFNSTRISKGWEPLNLVYEGIKEYK